MCPDTSGAAPTRAPQEADAPSGSAGAGAKPRLAIVTAQLGIPSEVWMMRQAAALTAFSPHLLGWSRTPDSPASALPETLLGRDFPAPRGPWPRLLRKLGSARALALPEAERRVLQQALEALAPDLVLVHFGWTAIAVAQALPPGVPMVLHVHGRDVSVMMRQRAYRRALARALKRCAALVAVGAHQIDRLRPLGLPERTALIPCGAPLDLFAAAPLPAQPAATAETPLRFLSVGRLSPEKGMMETLQAFEALLPDCPGAELVLIGYGPQEAALRARIAGAGLESRVRLSGRLSPEGIAAELARGHVYLQHSRQYGGALEGFGVTLTEAGAAGLPLLASASGGLKDQIVEGENGWLFPEGDVAAQSALMLRLARDPALRARMGARARVLAGRFDSTVMAGRLQALLLDVGRGADPDRAGHGRKGPAVPDQTGGA